MTTAKVKIESKTYLGDGLYCEDESHALRVWTFHDDSGAFSAAHEIYLNADALQALVTFARHRGYVIK